jgi:hypothetical protein
MKERPSLPKLVDTPNARSLIAANILAMVASAKFRSVRSWAIHYNINPQTVRRIVKLKHAVSIDTLDEIAKSAGIEPWQLLAPQHKKAEPPVPGKAT